MGLCLILIPNPLLSQNIPTKGLVAAYLLDSNARDTGPNNFHGTIKGPVSTTGRDGTPNSAYYFDGNGDYMEFPMGDSLPAKERTVSIWINPDYQSLQNGRALMGYGGNGTCGTSFMMVLNNAGAGGFETQQHCVVNRFISKFDCNVESNWHNWTVVTKSKGADYYFDGQLIASNAAISYQTAVASNHKFYLGEITDHIGGLLQNSSVIMSFKGSIDDVLIYNRALSTNEISRLSKQPVVCDSVVFDTTHVIIRDTIIQVDTTYVTINDTVLHYDTLTVHDTLMIDRTTVSTHQLPGNILVYPNPAKDRLSVQVDNSQQFGGYQLQLTDSKGKDLWTRTISNPIYSIDISSYSAGIYFFRVMTTSGSVVETRKIVIK